MDNKSPVSKISRRNFLKRSLAVFGAAVSGGALLDIGISGLVKTKAAKAAGIEKWVKSYCSSCIWQNCGTEVRVVDGVAVELRGNKQHPSNQGALCPRGSSQLMSMYNPYRIKAPLKRTNPEKGLDVDPKWVEISWDEATSIVAEHIKTIMKTDPRKFLYMIGFSSNGHENIFGLALSRVIGSPNVALTSGPLCEVHYSPTSFNTTYVDRLDLNYCNYVVSFGRNLGGATMFASGPGRALADALKRGLKIVSVDPHCSPEASKGEWVPIRPATDLAMGLAMLHVILHELNKYDVQAMKFRSDAPYLLDAKGEYLRNANGKPLMWDAKKGKAKAYDDPALADPALEGDFIVNGTKVSSCFMALKNHVKSYTPEWAREITDVSAETIRRITKELVEHACIGQTITIDGYKMPYRPACIVVGRGAANQFQGKAFYFVADVINLVIGAIGVPGSIITNLPMNFKVKDGLMDVTIPLMGSGPFTIPAVTITGTQFYPRSVFPVFGHTMGAILEPKKYYVDYEIDTIFPYGSNPFTNFASWEDTVEVFKKVPFIFTLGYVLDEMTMFCDIVLPESSNYERRQVRHANETMTVGDNLQLDGWNYKEPVLDNPLYNTKQFEDVFADVFEKVGPQALAAFYSFYNMSCGTNVDVTKKHDYAELCDARLKKVTGDPNKGIDYFREKGFEDMRVPLAKCYDYYYLNFASKARLHIYDIGMLRDGKKLFKNLKAHGIKEIPGWEGKMDEVKRDYVALYSWYDNRMNLPNQEFDMYAVNWKISCRNLGVGGQDDNPYLREIVENWDFDDLYIQINEKTAAKKGLKTNDKIYVESITGGTVEGIIKTTNLIRPDCLGFPGQAGRRAPFVNPITRKGSNYNRLLSNKACDTLPDSGSVPISVRVKLKKIN